MITVIFNRPVVPLVTVEDMGNLPQPLEFDPPLEGEGEWLNTSIYMFTPSDGLRGGTDYTVTVKAGLEDITGGILPRTTLAGRLPRSSRMCWKSAPMIAKPTCCSIQHDHHRFQPGDGSCSRLREPLPLTTVPPDSPAHRPRRKSQALRVERR